MLIYHVVLPQRWAEFENENFYEAESLKAEGFIHCSYQNQLEGVLERYYADAETVLILTVNPNLLTAELVAEASTGGEVYPHVYGRINKEAVAEIAERRIR